MVPREYVRFPKEESVGCDGCLKDHIARRVASINRFDYHPDWPSDAKAKYRVYCAWEDDHTVLWKDVNGEFFMTERSDLQL